MTDWSWSLRDLTLVALALFVGYYFFKGFLSSLFPNGAPSRDRTVWNDDHD